jgi:tRNA(Ile)-lysidine synthase
MRFGAALLDAVLDECLPENAAGLVVGVSGGADSACLLSALAELRRERRGRERERSRGSARHRGNLVSPAESAAQLLPLRAVHVDHGLQAASSALRESCRALCSRLEVPLTVIEVSVDAIGESLEAAAREARYRAFASNLAPEECLLTAHHGDDQAETLLLQLLRGAGIKGLSAMPRRRRLGAGWHLRPLLQLSRRDLEAYASAHGVEAREDPMNRDPRFDRAFLRSEIWPLIIERWPSAGHALGRAARHAADAQELLDKSADAALTFLRDGGALSVPGLRAMPAHERVNVLRRWLSEAGMVVPSSARIAEGLRQALAADSDHMPMVVWGTHALRRYRERLYVTPATIPSLLDHREWRVRAEARLDLGEGLGFLRWVPRRGGLDAERLPAVLSVRRRVGGESLKPGSRARTRRVAHLCQDMGILPWMRDVLPMIYAGDSLIAIGDIWRDARWLAAGDQPGLDCIWEDAPILC